MIPHGVQLDDLTQEQRLALFRDLARAIPVGPIELGTPDGACILPICVDKVEPDRHETVFTRFEVACRPRRLVILEPEAELIEYTTLTGCDRVEQVGPWWRRETCVVRGEVRTLQNVRRRRVERGLWTVSGIFVGAQMQFGALGSISGDAFGPSGEMEFGMSAAAPGFTITLNVRHAAAGPVPFMAVVLGQVMTEKQASTTWPNDFEDLTGSPASAFSGSSGPRALDVDPPIEG